MASAALLAACSFCFSGVYKVEGKPGHQEPLNLYVLIIADPAERKSPVMRYIREPFDSFCKVINDKISMNYLQQMKNAGFWKLN